MNIVSFARVIFILYFERQESAPSFIQLSQQIIKARRVKLQNLLVFQGRFHCKGEFLGFSVPYLYTTILRFKLLLFLLNIPVTRQGRGSKVSGRMAKKTF